MVVNGRTFEITKPSTSPLKPWGGFKSIYEAYKKPSSTKVQIYEDWERWFSECDTLASGVIASSSNFYTHGGIVRLCGNKLYNVRITYAHNYISEIL